MSSFGGFSNEVPTKGSSLAKKGRPVRDRVPALFLIFGRMLRTANSSPNELLLGGLLALLVLSACQKEEGCTDPDAENYESSAEEADGSCEYALRIRFEHELNGNELRFNDRDYLNTHGDTFRIDRLRYLISDLVLHRKGEADIRSNGHHLVRIAPNNSLTYVNGPDNPSLTWSPSIDAPSGDYEGLSFTFGFESEANISGRYGDLNRASWSWPQRLGGGYHFLQFEGEYDSNATSTPVFNMHMGKARDTSGSNTSYVNNHFRVEFEEPFSIDDGAQQLSLRMDLAKWFAPPPSSMDPGNGEVWKLKERPKAVMPHFGSQRVLNANGRDVFSFVP
jgi:hypothetical protein